MKCPRCGNELTKFKKFNVEVDYCNKCDGIWFDKNEISDLSSKYPAFNFPEPDLAKLSIAKTEESKFRCPRCGELMFKVYMSNKPPMFDYCQNGHGFWFDKNEFEQYVKKNISHVSDTKK